MRTESTLIFWRPLIGGFLLSTLIYAYALHLVVKQNRDVVQLQAQTSRALASTCLAWYELMNPKAKKKRQTIEASVKKDFTD